MAIAPSDTPLPNTLSAAVLRQRADLFTRSSLEMHPKEIGALQALREYLAPGARIYLPALPQQTAETVLDAACSIQRAGFEPVLHLAARSIASRNEALMFLRAAHAESGVRRIMLIGGDLAHPRGPYPDSVAVLRDGIMSAAGMQEFAIAGYPEGHPKFSIEQLDGAMAIKLESAAGQGLQAAVVTQFTFAPGRIVEFAMRLSRMSIDVPIHVGIAGPTEPLALARYAQRCGVNASRQALRRLGIGMARLLVNTDPGEQVLALARYCTAKSGNRIASAHFYSFGGVLRTAKWLAKSAATSK